jgi:WD40 repeat protein
MLCLIQGVPDNIICFRNASATDCTCLNQPLLNHQYSVSCLATRQTTAKVNMSRPLMEYLYFYNLSISPYVLVISVSGSLESEACIYAMSYDMSGSRLVTCEADKTIKMWKEDLTATPETHPINFKPPKDIRRY